MSSFPIAEQEESLFLLDEQPPPNLQKSESFDDNNNNNNSGLKSIQRVLSASSSLAASQQQPQPYRSLSAHDLAPSSESNDYGLPPSHPSRRSTTARNNINDIDGFVRQFETRLREHRIIWQKEYDTTVQRLNETKNSELETLKNRYETKLHTLEDGNKQLEMILEKLGEENQRLKFEIEHQRQQTQTEQVIKDYFNF